MFCTMMILKMACFYGCYFKPMCSFIETEKNLFLTLLKKMLKNLLMYMKQF